MFHVLPVIFRGPGPGDEEASSGVSGGGEGTQTVICWPGKCRRRPGPGTSVCQKHFLILQLDRRLFFSKYVIFRCQDVKMEKQKGETTC